jgi:hypothetical protein
MSVVSFVEKSLPPGTDESFEGSDEELLCNILYSLCNRINSNTYAWFDDLSSQRYKDNQIFYNANDKTLSCYENLEEKYKYISTDKLSKIIINDYLKSPYFCNYISKNKLAYQIVIKKYLDNWKFLNFKEQDLVTLFKIIRLIIYGLNKDDLCYDIIEKILFFY